MEKLIRIYIRLSKRRTRKFLSRWKMMTALRKSVLVNYSKIFNNDEKTAVRTKNGQVILLNHE